MTVSEVRVDEAADIVAAYRDRLVDLRDELGRTSKFGGDIMNVIHRIRATYIQLHDAEEAHRRAKEALEQSQRPTHYPQPN